MKRIRQSNNKGMSLMELMVVISIMAVMTGFLSLSLNAIWGKQAAECAEKVSARLDSTKTGSMSRYNEVMVLRILDKDSRDDIHSKGIYADNFITTIKYDAANKKPKPLAVSEAETRKMGNATVTVTAELDDGKIYELKEPGKVDKAPDSLDCSAIVVSYDRTTGALDCIALPKEVNVDDDLFVQMPGVYIKKLRFQQAGGNYVIDFIKDTGKHTLSRE